MSSWAARCSPSCANSTLNCCQGMLNLFSGEVCLLHFAGGGQLGFAHMLEQNSFSDKTQFTFTLAQPVRTAVELFQGSVFRCKMACDWAKREDSIRLHKQGWKGGVGPKFSVSMEPKATAAGHGTITFPGRPGRNGWKEVIQTIREPRARWYSAEYNDKLPSEAGSGFTESINFHVFLSTSKKSPSFSTHMADDCALAGRIGSLLVK